MFIYLHIPFCVSRCIYCDFAVVLEKYGGQQAYVDAVCREIDQRFSKAETALTPIQSLYVGGGTPSLLTAADYRRIFERLNAYAPFAANAEITLEVNPNGLRDDPAHYRAVGFNRVSVGVQSFNNHELRKLSRAHSADDAAACIALVQAAGFDNVSLDLMYGIPDQTAESWRETLLRAAALNVRHVSMYGLKVEEGTPLDTLVSRHPGSYRLPDDETTVAFYFQAVEALEAAGLACYEFSNLARPGYESRHNLNYWNNGDYWAFGVSAHGYVNHLRYETVRDLAEYLANPLAGEQAQCPMEERLENALIFGLRKREGVHIPSLEAEFAIDFESRYAKALKKYVPSGLLVRQGEQLLLSREAIPVSNTILLEFIGFGD